MRFTDTRPSPQYVLTARGTKIFDPAALPPDLGPQQMHTV